MHKVGVVGARGYSGLELVRILLRHPAARIEACFAHDRSFEPSDYLPEEDASHLRIAPISELDPALRGLDTLFLATPAEVSARLAPRALESGVSCIDLSGAFRLSADAAREWYQVPEAALGYLSRAEYGLVPWCGPSAGQGPRLIANPGCFATAVLMALLPLLRERLIDPASLAIDAKSGTTGGGRKADESLLFSEVEGECLPYRVGKHQHLPEIREFAARYASLEIDPAFVTHLLSVRRGILAGIYAKVSEGVSVRCIEEAYRSAYRDYPLARFSRVNPARRNQLSLKRVVGSARVEIAFELAGSRLYVFSLIDNLLKGAASQAVENFNRLHDFPVAMALTRIEGVL